MASCTLTTHVLRAEEGGSVLKMSITYEGSYVRYIEMADLGERDGRYWRTGGKWWRCGSRAKDQSED